MILPDKMQAAVKLGVGGLYPKLVILDVTSRSAHDRLAEAFFIKPNRVERLTNAVRLRNLALAPGIDMFVMAPDGPALADTVALHPAASAPDANCHAVGICQVNLGEPIAVYSRRSVGFRCGRSI